MKLNNKGFAITAILYTLLILFSLILISIISGLNTRNKMLEKSIDTIEQKYNWDCLTNEDIMRIYSKIDPENDITKLTSAPKKGKYIYTDNTIECYTYLLEGTDLTQYSSFTYTQSECQNKTLTLKGYCVPKE